MKKYFTEEGLNKFKKDFGYLESDKRKDVAEKIKLAVSQGDLSENAAYDAAKEEQGFVEGRIGELKSIIAQAELISGKANGKVQIGSIVVVSSQDGKEEFQIVGPEEADVLKNKISFKSPLGESLLDKRKGESLEIDAPGGKKTYKIISIK